MLSGLTVGESSSYPVPGYESCLPRFVDVETFQDFSEFSPYSGSHTAFRGRGRDAAIVYMCPPQGVTGGLTACLGAALEGGSARLG